VIAVFQFKLPKTFAVDADVRKTGCTTRRAEEGPIPQNASLSV
jgi:hypothetical protein